MDSDDEERELARLIKLNSRGWQSYWAWADKPVGERSAVRKVLSEAGVAIETLRSRADGEDPPDCEAIIGGALCGIEVTELVHQKTLQRSLKGHGQYFVWGREELLATIQGLIVRKDVPAKVKGGPYHRYILVIVTAEFFLDRDTVTQFLAGASFRARLITDAFLGLSYHASAEAGEGACPVFRLALDPSK